MAKKILKQGPGWKITLTDVPSTTVPYIPEDRADGHRNHGFKDLRGRPDLVDTVPEAAQNDGLGELLRVIAAPNSALMSIGCECGAFSRKSWKEGEPTRYIGSYFAIAFPALDLITKRKPLIDLACAIITQVYIDPTDVVDFEMRLEPLEAFFKQSGCYEMSVWLFAYGNSDREAWKVYNRAMFATADVIRCLQEETGSTR